jgi:peptidoglycan hydrolase-like protein with peptidoglycan-binding domain
MLLLRIFLVIILISVTLASMPAPFTRELKVTQPYQTGNDVTIAQTLLLRDIAVSSLTVTGIYDEVSAMATKSFQSAHGLNGSGVLGSATATLLLDLHSADNYKDSGFSAGSMGYLYKFYIPVNTNRSVETTATLYDKDNNELLRFRVRAHGRRSDGTSSAWPDYGTGDIGLTEFASNGNTVTGLVEIDFNTPEPNAQEYGPWPVNRIVRGLDGNAKTLLPNIRDGIMIHTGNWTTDTVTWEPTMDMPNSSGCIHAHPADVEKITSILFGLGVKANANTFSGKNYPYQCQGVGVIELIN